LWGEIQHVLSLAASDWVSQLREIGNTISLEGMIAVACQDFLWAASRLPSSWLSVSSCTVFIDRKMGRGRSQRRLAESLGIQPVLTVAKNPHQAIKSYLEEQGG
jgi:hypothetical protein